VKAFKVRLFGFEHQIKV